jgi:hypothetical protein
MVIGRQSAATLPDTPDQQSTIANHQPINNQRSSNQQ